MIQIPEYLNLERAQECLNDLNYYREEIRALFRSGQIDLSNMAKTEETYLYVINKIKTLLSSTPDITEELQDVIDNIDSKVKEWQSKSSYDGNYFEWKAKK